MGRLCEERESLISTNSNLRFYFEFRWLGSEAANLGVLLGTGFTGGRNFLLKLAQTTKG